MCLHWIALNCNGNQVFSFQLSYAEQARGDARKKWLQQMIVAAETSGSNMEPVYKSLFDAITKVMEMNGDFI